MMDSAFIKSAALAMLLLLAPPIADATGILPPRRILEEETEPSKQTPEQRAFYLDHCGPQVLALGRACREVMDHMRARRFDISASTCEKAMDIGMSSCLRGGWDVALAETDSKTQAVVAAGLFAEAVEAGCLLTSSGSDEPEDSDKPTRTKCYGMARRTAEAFIGHYSNGGEQKETKQIDRAASASKRRPEPTKRCPDGMAAVPGGTFTLTPRGVLFGSDQRLKVGAVGVKATVVALCMDVTEVTVRAYRRCIDAGACTTPWTPGGPAPYDVVRRRCTYDVPGKSDHPVNCVDWDQAVGFCRWVGKRLPTEEEWEWAARGAGAQTAYPWGDDEIDRRPCSRASGLVHGTLRPTEAFDPGTCPVGNHPAGNSPQGVADLAENVTEWTAEVERYSAEVGRVVMGGNFWDIGFRKFAPGLRAVWPPWARLDYVGFRCVKTR